MDFDELLRGARRARKLVGQIRTVIDESIERSRQQRSQWETADSSETSPEELARLAREGHPFVVMRVAQNPRTPVEVLRQLANQGEPVDPNSPDAPDAPDAESVPSLRAAVAMNPSLPADLRQEFITDESPWVRAGLAGNPKTGPEELASLADDEDERVRVAVAANPETPAELLVALARDSENEPWTARAVADNPRCPEDLARRLRSEFPEPEAETARSSTPFGPRAATEAGFGIALAVQMARRQERQHPDDPGMAVLGLVSGALKKAAMELADAGRENEEAVADLVQKAGRHEDALRRAALWLRCDGQAEEQVTENLAHRLLQAAITGAAVAPISAAQRHRLVELEALRASPAEEAFDVLVAKEPGLGVVADGVVPVEGLPPRAEMGIEPVRSWVAISPAFGIRAMSRVPVVGARVPAPLLDLIEKLEAVVGPASGSNDPVVSSHLALNLALAHCVSRLYATA